MLYCEKGTHPRRLNLPKCHGVYILDKPMARKNDCVPEENISSFGVCTAETPPAGAEEVMLGGYVLDGEDVYSRAVRFAMPKQGFLALGKEAFCARTQTYVSKKLTRHRGKKTA